MLLNHFSSTNCYKLIRSINNTKRINFTKMALSEQAKERLGMVFEVAKTVFHWGFIPTVLYLGFSKGSEANMPPLSVASLLWQ
ncbi:unnamed protein product [Chironomus riparius]|uniref:Mitochondrial import receptor subunit TOM7 homolog n=1 Tax=Chironomus riparius TaxID=315576 RepID=A0A9N9RWF3_9DIPT|nr:unnamed protein product [Chironomus riparius]